MILKSIQRMTLVLTGLAVLSPITVFGQAMMRPDVMGREAAVVSDHALA